MEEKNLYERKRVTISIPSKILELIDIESRKLFLTRSAFITQLIIKNIKTKNKDESKG